MRYKVSRLEPNIPFLAFYPKNQSVSLDRFRIMWKPSSGTTFLKIAAICSLLGAMTTALLLFLAQTPAADFEAQLLLHKNPLYLSKRWILFLHPQFNLMARLDIGFHRRTELGLIWSLLLRITFSESMGGFQLSLDLSLFAAASPNWNSYLDL